MKNKNRGFDLILKEKTNEIISKYYILIIEYFIQLI